MSDNFTEQLGSKAAQQITQALERLRLQLRKAEIQAPPHIYQMIEELRSVVASDADKALDNLRDALQRLGASEEEFIEWLQLDMQLLERKLYKALSLAADPSRIDLAAWRSADPDD